MGSSSIHRAGEMCMESGRARAAARRGGKQKAAAAEQKASKQPQRGLGVAQLEKIRLHNQMLAAYRSGSDVGIQVPFAAPAAVAPVAAASSSFLQPAYLSDDCGFKATDGGIIGVHYYDNLLPYSSSPPPGQRRQPQQHHWVSRSDGSSSTHSSAVVGEELDLELRL